MARFKPGMRIKYRDGVIYQVAKDGSYRREGGVKPSKAEKKAEKKGRRRYKDHRRKNNRDHRLEACATGVKK